MYLILQAMVIGQEKAHDPHQANQVNKSQFCVFVLAGQ